MGGVPVKHRSKSGVGRHRAHQALKKMRLLVCPQCHGPVLPHRACANCKAYQQVPSKSAA